MDILFLHGIKIDSLIGVYEWERQRLQTLLLDLDLSLPDTAAFFNDDIKDTIDYAKLLDQLRQHVANLDYHLLEALAEEIARFIMEEFGVPKIKVRLIKPGVLPAVSQVGIEIVRGQY